MSASPEERPEKLQVPLDEHIQRLPTTATWDDLVLADHVLAQLREIATHARLLRRGPSDERDFAPVGRTRSISALLTGDRGTGRTLAAQVLANELQLDLYRIDLAAVVSKWVGDTEKNLARVFDAAAKSAAILLFDEADALFGKRSEVEDSHDRYANIEVGDLLQRIENSAGLVILVSNRKPALDSAFTRRLRFIVDFPRPDQANRKEIWQRVFPVDATTERLDYGRLSRFELTGGNIRNVALEAALRASAAGSPVTMPLILEAARAECLKLGRPSTDADRA